MNLSTHPLNFITPKKRTPVFWGVVVLTIGCYLVLQNFNAQIITDAAPKGIISYEFARYSDIFQRIHSSWTPNQFAAAGLSLGFDFLFLILYPLAISLGTLLVSAKTGWIKISVFFCWIAASAGVLDAVENISLIQVLTGNSHPYWGEIAYFAAGIKFSFVGLSLLFVMVGALAGLTKSK